MAYKLQLKRGVLASLPNGSVGEPLFTTDTFDLYVGKGDGTNVKIQKFIASGSSSQFLKGDGSLDSNTYIGLTALSASAPLSYNNTTGAFTISQAGGSTNGYLSSGDWTTFNAKQAALSGSGIVKSTGGTISYLTDNSANWDTAYNDKINSASVSGTTTKTLTLTQQDGGTVTASWSDYDTAPVTSVFGRTGAVVAANGDYTTSQVTEGTNLYYTDARARAAITLTTTGSSGASTYVGGTLNIPTYTLAGLGGVASSRQLTINGTAYDLSADRIWSVGTVTSVDMSVPTGFAITGNPITSSGTLALAFATGYSLPTNASQTNWDAAYNDKINSASVTGTTTKTLTLTQQDGGTITASWSDYDTAPVTSVFGRTGVVTAQSGDYTTTQVTEGTNLYYTEGRVSANTDVAANTAARHSAVTIGTANGLSLSTQQLSLGLASGSTTGALSSTDWTTFNSKQAALNGTGFVKISGTTISYDNSTYYLASNPSSYIAKTDLSAVTPLSYDNVTGVFQMTQANSTTSGYITSTDWNTFNNKQSALTNPITGTGTTNYLPKFTGSTTIGNSGVSDDGTTVTLNSRALSGTSAVFSSSVTATGLFGYYLKGRASDNYGAFGFYSNDGATRYGYIQSHSSNGGQLNITGDGGGQLILDSRGHIFSIGSEQMRLTSTGLGIGTTTFATDSKLAVQTSGGKFDVRGIGVASIVLESNGGMHYNAPTGNFHKFQINNSTLMELNGSGNLGLGVTPSAWASDWNVFQIGSISSLSQYNNNNSLLLSNNYYNSTIAGVGAKYIANGTAGVYQISGNNHYWYNAPSGTSGSAITLTLAMTLTASGRLLLGTTTDAGYLLDVNGSGRFSGSITTNSTSTFSNASGLSAIFSNGGSVNNYNSIELRGGTAGTAVNWQISKDNSTANAFELAASTTAGGTTYSSPVFKILNTGAATFSSSVTAGTPYVSFDSFNARGKIFLDDSTRRFVTLGMDSNVATLACDYYSGAGGASPDFAIKTNATERMRITSTGIVQVNTTASIGGGVMNLNGDLRFGGVSGASYSIVNYQGGALNLGTNNTTYLTIKSDGIINLSNVPSSSAGLSSGDIYKDASGFLKIV